MKSAAAGFLGFAAAVRGVGLAYEQLIASNVALGDELSKQSDRLGISIGKLQEWRFGAESAGATTEQLETALRALQRTSSEAARGQTEYAAAFSRLGVSVTDANGQLRSVESLLPDVADALSEMTSEGDRTAIAMKLMEEGGTRLVPMLQNGSAGMAEMSVRARELGLVMDDETARAGERAAQAMTELEGAFQGLRNEASQELIPAFTTIVQGLTTVVTWTNKLIDGWDVLAASAGALNPILGTAARIYGMVADNADDAGEAVAQSAADATAASAPWVASNNSIANSLRLAEEAQRRLNEERREATRIQQESEQRASAARDEDTEMLLSGLPDGTGYVEALTERLAGEEAATNATIDRIVAARVEMWEQLADMQTNAARERDTQLSAELQTYENLASSVGSAMGVAFGQIISGTRDAGDAGRQLLGTLASVVAGFLAQAIAGAASSQASIPYVGPALAAGAAASIAAAIPAMISGATASKPYALGGIVEGGIPGKDSVPILAMPGEAVLPVDLVEGLKSIVSDSGGSRGGVTRVEVVQRYEHVVPPNAAEIDRQMEQVYRSIERAAARGHLRIRAA